MISIEQLTALEKLLKQNADREQVRGIECMADDDVQAAIKHLGESSAYADSAACMHELIKESKQ
jgi:hypothetical protein